MKKAIVTFITYDYFEAVVPVPNEVYETGNVEKAVEIVQKQMLEELGYNYTKYIEAKVDFVNEED